MTSSRKSTAAFTLTEILIGVVITTMIVVMLGTIFVGLTGTSLRANQRMDAFRDARGALSMMRRDVSNLVRAVPTAYFALADQYNDPNTASTKNRQLYALTSIKNGLGDVCAVGYYCRWDSTKHAYTLCRYFSSSAATLAILQNHGAEIYALANKLFIPATSDETVAAYVWNLQITAYKTDGTVDNTYPLIINPVDPSVVLPAALEISFDVISPQAAQGMLNASSTPNDWMDSTTTNYRRFIAPHAYEFRSRINF